MRLLSRTCCRCFRLAAVLRLVSRFRFPLLRFLAWLRCSSARGRCFWSGRPLGRLLSSTHCNRLRRFLFGLRTRLGRLFTRLLRCRCFLRSIVCSNRCCCFLCSWFRLLFRFFILFLGHNCGFRSGFLHGSAHFLLVAFLLFVGRFGSKCFLGSRSRRGYCLLFSCFRARRTCATRRCALL